MKKFGGLFFANLILVLIQQAFFGELFGLGYTPHIALALTFALFVTVEMETTLLSGLLCGVLTDLLGTGPVGLSAVFCVSYLLFVAYIKKRFIKGAVVNIIAFVAFSCLYDLLGSFSSVTVVFNVILVRALLGLISLGVFYFIIQRFLDEKYSL